MVNHTADMQGDAVTQEPDKPGKFAELLGGSGELDETIDNPIRDCCFYASPCEFQSFLESLCLPALQD